MMRRRILALAALAVGLWSCPARADKGVRWIGSLATAELVTPTGGASPAFDHFGAGGALSLLMLDDTSRLCGGIDASALFVAGAGRQRFYDLSVGLVGSPPRYRQRVVPFLSLGLDMAATTLSQDGRTQRGLSLGVHGNVGLHRAVGRLYLRAQIGYVAAGLGGFKGELALGYVFE